MTDHHTHRRTSPGVLSPGQNCVPVRMIGFKRWPLALFALVTPLVCAGCPEAQIVEVTIKPVAGAEAAAEGDSGADESAAGAGYGNLVGTITFDGSVPAYPALVNAGDSSVKDAAVCAAAAIPDETLVVNSENKGIANVVIFLEKRPGNIKPELAKPPTDPVFFDQKGCRFLPHLVTVQVGQPLLVISDDGIPHNTHTNPKRNDSFNKVISANERKGIPCDYKKAESAPLSVVCDYHPWMKAYHFPVDHPYVAVSDKDGKFRIEGLPAGKQSFNVWHERAPGDAHLLERKLQITIEADSDSTRDLTYGGAKFAARPTPAGRVIAYERLLSGGDIIVSQAEGKE